MLITDPDLLNQGTEVIFDKQNKTIQLVKAGNLSDDGVTLQCIYSFCKEEWKDDPELIKYPFPILAITEEKFEMINGWDWKDETTKNLIRKGGWALNPSGTIQEEYAGIITLGSLTSSDQVYYQQYPGGPAINVVLPGNVNQAVKIYGDANHGNFDYRSYFKIFVRSWGKTYDMSQLSDIGVTTMTYQVYRFPLTNYTDLKITHTESEIIGETPYFAEATDSGTDGSVTENDATFTVTTGIFESSDVGKYICIKTGNNKGVWKIVSFVSSTEVEVDRNFLATESNISFTVNPPGMSVEWFESAQSRTIGSNSYNFHVIIDGNQGTAEQIYEYVQFMLRQDMDIDAGSGSKNGKTTSSLLKFVGDSLYTLRWTSGEGTYIDDHREGDRTRLYFLPDTGDYVQFPYAAILTLNFGDYLKNDPDAIYRVYFTNDDAGSNLGRDYSTEFAILVNTFRSYGTVKRSRSSNVATIETDSAHGLVVGDGVHITGLGGSGAMYAVAKVPTSGGTGYQVGDILNVTEGTGGKVRVTAVSGGGVVTAISLYDKGTGGYTVGTGKATTGGSGTGCTIEITSAGYNGNWIVASTPTSTKFTFANIGSDESETSDTGGTVTRVMAGKVNGASSIQFTYDYDNNIQRGPGSAGTDAPITVVAIGLGTAQFVSNTGIIQRTLSNTVALIAALERNYSNP